MIKKHSRDASAASCAGKTPKNVRNGQFLLGPPSSLCAVTNIARRKMKKSYHKKKFWWTTKGKTAQKRRATQRAKFRRVVFLFATTILVRSAVRSVFASVVLFKNDHNLANTRRSGEIYWKIHFTATQTFWNCFAKSLFTNCFLATVCTISNEHRPPDVLDRHICKNWVGNVSATSQKCRLSPLAELPEMCMLHEHWTDTCPLSFKFRNQSLPKRNQAEAYSVNLKTVAYNFKTHLAECFNWWRE